MTMTPYALLGIAVLTVLTLVIFGLIISPRRKRLDGKLTDFYDPLGGSPGKIDKMQDRFRDGGIAHSQLHDDAPQRTFGKRNVPPVRYPTIVLTPRMLEHANTQRKLRGKPPLNRAGFKNAVSHAWGTVSHMQPDNSNDWLMYLILYECLLSDHQSSTVAGNGSLTIDPNLPYNGAGGEFVGAGASGDWTRSDASQPAADSIAASPERAVEPAIAGDGYHYTDPDPYATIAAGTLLAGAPDPSSDSSSSDSSSSDSSSSSDGSSDSSSSDSGGSSGGGGD